MYLVKDISGAIGLMVVALVLLGTWPVVLAVLERRGRLPQHTFLDFSVTNFLAAVLIALTFGQIGPDTPATPNFLTQLTHFLVAGFPFQATLAQHLATFSVQYIGPEVTFSFETLKLWFCQQRTLVVLSNSCSEKKML